MSKLEYADRPCACGAVVRVLVAETINGGRHPHLREAIISGMFHRYHCEVCGQQFSVDVPLFYFDFERKQFIGVYPVDELPRAGECARLVAQAFDRTVAGEMAALQISETASQFLVRVCFGYDELREKLLCDEARMSDLALEELKCQVLASDPAFRASNVVTLWLGGMDDKVLCFRPASLGGAALNGVEIDRQFYDEIARHGDDAILANRPGLASGPHVSMLRLVRWATAGSPASSAGS